MAKWIVAAVCESGVPRSSWRATLAGTVALVLAAISASGQPMGECGDCDGDGNVAINELIMAVNIAVGAAPLSTCSAADVDNDGTVGISDLIRAVGRATSGVCPSPIATESLTPSPTPTATPSPVPQLEGDDLVQASSEIALENVSSFQVLDFGAVGAHYVPSLRMRLAARPRRATVELRAGDEQRGVVAPVCNTGSIDPPTCTDDTLTVVYHDCATTRAGGGTLVRSGRVVQAVSNSIHPPVVCDTGNIRPEEDTVVLTLDDYHLVERDAQGHTLADLRATATERFVPARAGCLAAEATPTTTGAESVDGVQTIDGSYSVDCSDGATSVSCPPGGTQRTLRPHALTLTRSSGGFPCVIGVRASGALEVEDRASGATFTQSFDDFMVNETTAKDDPATSLFTEDGRLSVDCLGALTYETKVETAPDSSAPIAGAITFRPAPVSPGTGQACPVDGLLEVHRPLERTGGAFFTGRVALSGGMGANEVVVGGSAPPKMSPCSLSSGAGTFNQNLCRAADGTVYQILQNGGVYSDFGADAIQITSLIGTAAGPLATCALIANATVDPQAEAATFPNFAYPPELVFKSALIHDASKPCFSRPGNTRRGIVCIGPDCDLDCICRNGGQCTSYSRPDPDQVPPGARITERSDGIPPARLVTIPNGTGCRKESGLETYRFGDEGPTLETRQCLAAPPDGFVLRGDTQDFPDGQPGTTVIFAYHVPLTSLFNAGYGGFAIDQAGGNLICRGQPGVLHIGQANGQSVAPPSIRYTAAGVQYDSDGDGMLDFTRPCAVQALLRCQ